MPWLAARAKLGDGALHQRLVGRGRARDGDEPRDQVGPALQFDVHERRRAFPSLSDPHRAVADHERPRHRRGKRPREDADSQADGAGGILGDPQCGHGRRRQSDASEHGRAACHDPREHRQHARARPVRRLACQRHEEHALLAAAADLERVARGTDARIAHDPCPHADRDGAFVEGAPAGASAHRAVGRLRAVQWVVAAHGPVERRHGCPAGA
jgi:hypothetical protein